MRFAALRFAALRFAIAAFVLALFRMKFLKVLKFPFPPRLPLFAFLTTRLIALRSTGFCIRISCSFFNVERGLLENSCIAAVTTRLTSSSPSDAGARVGSTFIALTWDRFELLGVPTLPALKLPKLPRLPRFAMFLLPLP